MCDPGIIQKKVEEFVSQDAMFTSIDIGNAIKLDGTWVKNREVAAFLRKNCDDDDIFPDYEHEAIDVNGGQVQATLYYPSWKDPDEYKTRDLKALKPGDLKGAKNQKVPSSLASDASGAVQSSVNVSSQPASSPPGVKKKRLNTTKATGTDIASAFDDNDDVDLVRTIASEERIKIPGDIVKKLGWQPGDMIDTSVIETHAAISARLKVNKDYRVSIPRTAVGWSGHSVKVMLKSGKIVFDKA